MKRDLVADILQIDELVDLAVGVAGDVAEGGREGRLLLQAVNGQHREELVHGPHIRQGLEDAEIGDELIGQGLVEVLELLGDVLHALVAEDARELAADLPEHDLALGPVVQGQVAQVEHRDELVLLGDGVVVHLGEVLHGDVVPGVGQLLQHLGLLPRQFHAVLGVGRVDQADDVDDGHGMIGGDRPSRFAHQGRHRHLFLAADLLGGVDHIGGVFLERVVHGTREGGPAAVIVHGHATAHVQVLQGHAPLAQLGVHPRGLLHGRLDLPYVRDLAAHVEVQFLQGIQHAALLESRDGFQDLLGVETELGVVPRRVLPFPAAHGVELEAQAQQGFHLQFLGHLQDQGQFRHLLHGDEHIAAGLLGQEGHADEGLVLVAVASHQGLGVQVHGKGDHQLGFRPCFQPKAVLVTRFHDLIHHLLQLIGLHGIDALVVAFVVEFLDGLPEGLVELRHPPGEDLRKSQGERRIDPFFLQVLDDFVQIAAEILILRGIDLQVSLAVDAEEVVTPLLHAVHRHRILKREVFHGHLDDPPLGTKFVIRKMGQFIQ